MVDTEPVTAVDLTDKERGVLLELISPVKFRTLEESCKPYPEELKLEYKQSYEFLRSLELKLRNKER